MKKTTKILPVIAGLLSFGAVQVLAQTGTPITNSDLPYTISKSGNYYISEDLTSSNNEQNGLIKVNSDVEATLDLNGKTIKATGSACYHIILNCGILTITDSSSEHKGTIDGGLGGTIGGVIGKGVSNEGTLTITGGTIKDCYARGGAGVSNSNNGTLTINGEYVVIDNCQCNGNPNSGGGVFNDTDCTFNLISGTISNCKANDYSSTSYSPGGGGVYNKGTMNMSGGTISDCKTTKYGGGVNNAGTMNMSGGTIKSCVVTFTGFDGSSTDEETIGGGGICNTGTLNITKGNITYNKSVLGAGILSCGSKKTLTVEATDVSDVLIDHNTTSSASKHASWGGGIYIFESELIFKNGTITNNTSNYVGGAIALNAATATISGGLINGNTAVQCGGGIHSGFSSTTTIGTTDGDNTKLLITENKVTDASTKTGDVDGGGGICVGYTGKENNLTINNCTISENTSNADGGGIYMRFLSGTGNNVLINGGLIEGNTAGRNGGGLYTKGTVTVASGSLSNNKAVKGAGIYMAGSNDFTMTGGSIDGNESTGDGGGIWAGAGTSTTEVNITSGEIINNVSKTNGGGLYVIGKITLSGSNVKLESNTATSQGGGIYSGTGSNTTIKGGVSIKNNSAEIGGAAWLKGTNNILDAETTIENNTARLGGAFYVDAGTTNISAGVMRSNSATENGGVLYTDGGKTNLTGGTLSGNSAQNGGALFGNGGEINQEGMTLTGNTSTQNGGAIYNSGATMNIYSGKIEKNIAQVNGGGIYSDSGSITFTKKEDAENYGTIRDNSAMNGGGVYLTSAATLTFNFGLISGNRAASSGSAIQTAWHSDASVAGTEISGVGGGIYVGKGTSTSKRTTLIFDTSSSSLGVYSNIGENAADDIFADGSYTSVTLPNASKTVIIGYAGYAKGWFADYVTDDTKYTSGLFSSGTGVRYRESTSPVEYSTPTVTKNDTYMCLALGIQLSNLTLQKKGLKTGESAIFTLSSSTDTRKVILTGVDDTGTTVVSATLTNLSAETWTIKEDTNWSWAYNAKESTKTVDMSVEKDKDKTVLFENTSKSSTPGHDEAIKENILGKTFNISMNGDVLE